MKEVYTTIPAYGHEIKPSLEITDENRHQVDFDARIVDPRTVENHELSRNNALQSNNVVLNRVAELMGLEELPKAINDFNHNPDPERREIITEILAENGRYVEETPEPSYGQDMKVSRKMEFKK